MKSAFGRVVWTVGLLGVSAAALAGEPKTAPPQEPAGFIAGGVIGAFAAGPVGAVIGAGLGTWLGNRVHRAAEATRAQEQVAALEAAKSQLQAEKVALQGETSDLAETNRALTARLDELSHSVEAAQSAREAASGAAGDAGTRVAGSAVMDAAGSAGDATMKAAMNAAGSNEGDATRDAAAKVLDGLQGDVLFRTGSAELTPEMAHGIEVLAAAVAKSPALKVRLDGYADPRGTEDTNLKLSEARADAVRDLFLAAGVTDEALEVNAYGKSQSTAADNDGYALERRVRLTLQADGAAAVARTGAKQATQQGPGETAVAQVGQKLATQQGPGETAVAQVGQKLATKQGPGATAIAQVRENE